MKWTMSAVIYKEEKCRSGTQNTFNWAQFWTWIIMLVTQQQWQYDSGKTKVNIQTYQIYQKDDARTSCVLFKRSGLSKLIWRIARASNVGNKIDYKSRKANPRLAKKTRHMKYR